MQPRIWSTTIGELCDLGIAEISTGPFGSQLHARDYVNDGVPVVPTVAIRERRIERSSLPQVSERKAAELSRHLLRAGDILFARRGVQATGRTALVRRDDERMLCGTGVIRLRIDMTVQTVSPRLISHALSAPHTVAWIKQHAIGATMPNLNEGVVRSIPLAIPRGFEEQEHVANILDTYDEKIDLNRRMRATLEAMALALFKSWFIDFDPVRAKAEGRDTGLPPHIADLFPDSFLESEIGEVPEGWKIGQIGGIAKFRRDSVRPSDFPEELFDHFSIPAFDDGRTPVVEPGDSIKSNKYAVRPADVLLSKLNPRIPRVWLPEVTGDRIAICSTEFLVATSRESVSREYLYCLYSSGAFSAELATLVTGTSGSHQRVRPAAVLEMTVPIAPNDLVRAFSGQAKPLFDRVARCQAEANTLVEMRKKLIPRLLFHNLRRPNLDLQISP